MQTRAPPALLSLHLNKIPVARRHTGAWGALLTTPWDRRHPRRLIDAQVAQGEDGRLVTVLIPWFWCLGGD